jgi:hypothetical protein
MTRSHVGRVAAVAAVLALLTQAASPAAETPLGDLKQRLRRVIHAPEARVAPSAQTRAPGEASAAAYHYQSTLICSDCHVMHYSVQHSETDGSPQSLPGGGPFPMLLKEDGSLGLCLLCHDGVAGIPDVVGADTNGLAERAGGFFEAPDTLNFHGHNLGSSGSDGLHGSDACTRCHFGGDPATATVTCIDCHNPHGNGRPRNLQWVSDPDATPQLGLFIDPQATGLDRYEAGRVAYGTSGTVSLREVTNICLDCHHVFSGSYYTGPDGSGHYLRHPVSESERGVSVPVSLGDADGGTDSAHWVDGSGAGFDVPRLRYLGNPSTSYASATVVSSDNNVFCLTCHKAHGSQHPFGLTWENPTLGAGPSGCDQCHRKSG